MSTQYRKQTSMVLVFLLAISILLGACTSPAPEPTAAPEPTLVQEPTAIP